MMSVALKKLFFLIAYCLAALALFGQSSANPKLARQIDSLYQVDQLVQTSLIKESQQGATKERLKVLFANVSETFKRHNAILKTILNQHGYPTEELVGKESSSHFFVLVQHADSDIELQRRVLKMMKSHERKKQIRGVDYAMLTDRVKISLGKKQIYGSQLDYDENGNAFAVSLYKPNKVNKRRAKYGLEPLEEYLKKMNELHGEMNKN